METKDIMDPKQRWQMLDTLVPVILQHVEGCIVEIGTGGSTEILMKIAESIGRKFYSCDIVNESETYYIEHHHSKMSSSKFMKEFTDEPAVVFLDGDHRYEMVREEFYFFYEKLRVGGVIFMHDTLPPNTNNQCGTVYKLRHELENSYMDCFTWPYTAGKGKVVSTGLTMVIKRDYDNSSNNVFQPAVNDRSPQKKMDGLSLGC